MSVRVSLTFGIGVVGTRVGHSCDGEHRAHLYSLGGGESLVRAGSLEILSRNDLYAQLQERKNSKDIKNKVRKIFDPPEH